VLSQDHQGIFSLRWTDKHNRVNDCLTESDIAVFFQAVSQEFQQDRSLAWDSLIEKFGGLDDLDLEVNAEIWKIVGDLLQQFLH